MSLRARQFAVVLLAALALGTTAAEATDPFYTKLLRDGAAARARGDLETAIQDLTIACFGLLDEPALLAQGLVELGLAQADAGQSHHLSRSMDRLLEVEELFQGYSRADLPDDARARFEDLVYARVDAPRLAGLDVFAPLAARRELETLAAAGPDQRRLMLQERLADDPTNTQWRRMAADLELSQGQAAAAVLHLSALLDQTPSDPFLRCERFRTAAGASLCDVALSDLAACPTDAADGRLAQPILQCFIDRTDWREAASFLDTLPATVRSTSKIRKLDRQVQRELRNLPVVTDTGTASPAATGDASAGEAPGDASRTDPLTDRVAPVPESHEQDPGAGSEPVASETALDEPVPSESVSIQPDLTEPPGDLCDAFEAQARDGRCDLAMADLATCQTTVTQVRVARPLLRCLVDGRYWTEATGLLAALPAGVRNHSRIRKLERQVTEGLAEADTTPGTPEAPTPSTEPPEEPAAVDPTASQTARLDPTATVAAEPPDEPEATVPSPDPCDPFRAAVRAGRCDVALTETTSCLGAAAERDLAPTVMECHTEARLWADALAFAELLPPQVRGLSKIRKLERRATKQLARQQSPSPLGATPGDDGTTSPDTGGLSGDLTGTPERTTEATASTGPEAQPRASASPPSDAALANARRVLASASTSADITRAYAVTSRLALDHPDHRESQLLAAQGAYRAAQWDQAVGFFRAASPIGNDQPLLQFYYAIALFETGQPRQAADLLEAALPRIRRTPFVDSYVARIQTAAGRE